MIKTEHQPKRHAFLVHTKALPEQLSARYVAIVASLDKKADEVALHAVADALADMEQVFSVSICVGSPEIIVNVRATDWPDLHRVLVGPLAQIEGIKRIDSRVCLDITLFRSGFGQLESPLPQGNAEASTPDLEEKIITLLQTDGRISNREIARRLDVSEGAVRQRLKKLQTAKEIALGVVCQPDKLGMGAGAFIRLAISPRHVAATLPALKAIEPLFFVGTMTGRFNVTLFALTTSPAALADLCNDQIRAVDGIQEVDVRPVVMSIKHRYDLVRL
ncbi:MAG: Lrp/AsnC ligand binding domain-containing protein, partial [Verrucomicrobiota bacterium]